MESQSIRTSQEFLDEAAFIPMTVTGLGPNNEGTFGPTPETDATTLHGAASKSEYHRFASNRWVCVDGRGESSENRPEEVDPQIPGSLPVTNTAADFMNPNTIGRLRLSERITINTKRAIAGGKEVVVHGDEAHGQDGCAANAKMRPTLEYGAANVDVITPTVWGLSQGFGLDKFGVTQEDIVASLVAGGETAKDDTIFDVTPSQVIDIEVRDGAQYVALPGSHNERFAGLEMGAGTAFDNRGFAEANIDQHGVEQQAFAVALGKYVHETFQERIRDGESPHDAALQAMRGICYTVALTKYITNEASRAALFGDMQSVELPEAA